MPKINFYKSLSKEALDALIEHSLGNYLPFNGGLLQKYQLQNYGKRKEPKKGIKFYAVEYEPELKIKQSPIPFTNEVQFKEFNEFNESPYEEEEGAFEEELRKRIMGALNNNKQYFKWGISKGFKFHGYKKSKYYRHDENVDYEIHKKRDEEDPTIIPEHFIDYPKQSFFKIGLTNTTAKKRGLFYKSKQSSNPYKKILIEKDLTYLYKKINPADVEVFIYFSLFYKYWKEKLYFYSLNKINIHVTPHHQSLFFTGHTESFLYENVEEKLNVINEAFEKLEKFTYDQITIELRTMISFNLHWDRVCFHKRRLFDKFNFDKGISYKPTNYEIPKSFEKQFLKKIGFWDKWYSGNDNHLKALFDKRVEEFTLPNSKHC